MKKIYILILIFLVGFFVTLSYLLLKKDKPAPETTESESEILFEKTESWGPCPPSTICKQSIKLFNSGDLILAGNNNLDIKLEQSKIDEIIKKIKSTQVMNKDCISQEVLDYSATYQINLEKRTKEITFPGCRDEIRQIENLIPLVKTN